MTLREMGEKRLISEIIIPLLNPFGNLELAGDDCAIINIGNNRSISLSTDRVPSDLVSFSFGLINHYELGYYLAILNISDILSSGAKPVGLLLNLAFPACFHVDNLEEIIAGAKQACETFNCQIYGGDLSDAKEMNLVATSIGIAKTNELLYRKGCSENDLVYCSDYIGITATAFSYFLEAKKFGMELSDSEEKILISVFKFPQMCVELSRQLASLKPNHMITCMDNTDGIYQSLHEIGLLNRVGILLDVDSIPIHPISYKVAEFLEIDVFDLIFNAGADFKLIGTIAKTIENNDLSRLSDNGLRIIGKVDTSLRPGTVKLVTDNEAKEITALGWNYYGDKQ